MANFKWFTRVHRTIYQLSDGRLGATMAGRPMALLHTIGRKSGEVRSVPLVYYRFDDRGIIVLASNNGSPNPPAWWLNLQSRPDIDIQVGREKCRVTAVEVDESEREPLWIKMVAVNALIADYPAKAGRKIPIIRLVAAD